MTTLDHAVEDECRRRRRRGEGSEGGREKEERRMKRRDKFHVIMSAVKIALLVNLISRYVVEIS
jgi:hypothetical protein